MKQKPKQPFYKNKLFLWIAGGIVGLVIIVLLAFKLTAWPGALIIRAVF